MRVPPELMRGSATPPGGEPLRSRYVVRMTDGQRDWEIQLPEIATAYEVKVPLSGKPSPRLAVDIGDDDRRRPRDPAGPRGGRARGVGRSRSRPRGRPTARACDPPAGGSAPPRATTATRSREKRPARKPGDDKPPSAKASYLLTLARVKELYRTRQYELALVEIGELDRQYPDDEHILSMKGSLYERLGNKNLAREAWQQTLRINPYNLAVLEALQRLGK